MPARARGGRRPSRRAQVSDQTSQRLRHRDHRCHDAEMAPRHREGQRCRQQGQLAAHARCPGEVGDPLVGGKIVERPTGHVAGQKDDERDGRQAMGGERRHHPNRQERAGPQPQPVQRGMCADARATAGKPSLR